MYYNNLRPVSYTHLDVYKRQASEGGVYVDGKNVKDYEPDVLRANIGMTTQEVLLFSDTVDGNRCV